MRMFYLDASALAKRYTPEAGTPLINHLFASVSPDRLYLFNVGMAEVLSLLVRKRNAGQVSAADFSQALAELRRRSSLRRPSASLRPAMHWC